MPFDVASVRARLPGRRIEWFQSVASTMTVAARMAREGCTSGTIVGADEQTAGAGRQGHAWYSEAEAGLYVSIVLRLALEARALPVVMLALGLAARDAIAEVPGLAPDLRWPNDVLLDGRKCAGVLAHLEGDAVIAGIGINVNHGKFPGDIETAATSLRLAGAGTVLREDLLVALAQAVDARCRMDADTILRAFTELSSYAQGRRVRVEGIEGVTCGLDPSGFLIVRQDDGKEVTVFAGGVRPV